MEKKKVVVSIPSMVEEASGFTIRAFQVVGADNKYIGFESIIGQRTKLNQTETIHIPENNSFAVVLVYCEKSQRAIIYTVDRDSKVYFYRENHDFALGTIWSENTMAIIRNLLSDAKRG